MLRFRPLTVTPPGGSVRREFAVTFAEEGEYLGEQAHSCRQGWTRPRSYTMKPSTPASISFLFAATTFSIIGCGLVLSNTWKFQFWICKSLGKFFGWHLSRHSSSWGSPSPPAGLHHQLHVARQEGVRHRHIPERQV